jgi:hypothetical protein
MMGQIGTAIAGNLTIGGAGTGTTWMSPQTLGTNESMDMNHWSQVELQNFVKWFIEVNYPDAVKQYQAVRDIERQAEKAKEIEADLRINELMRQYQQAQMRGLQNAYPYSQYPYAATATQAISTATQSTTPPPKQESIWDAMKRMAGVK